MSEIITVVFLLAGLSFLYEKLARKLKVRSIRESLIK